MRCIAPRHTHNSPATVHRATGLGADGEQGPCQLAVCPPAGAMVVRRRLLPRPLWRTSPPEEGCRGPWGLVAVLLLAGYLLFAHGCHGDEDNELLAVTHAVAQSAVREKAPMTNDQ